MLTLTYVPDKGTVVSGAGKETVIPGKDFADALFTVWLGPDPVDGDLKRKLLGAEASAAQVTAGRASCTERSQQAFPDEGATPVLAFR